MALESMSAGLGLESATQSGCLTVLVEFTAAWENGQATAVEQYLRRLDPADSRAAVELIYREYCLSEADGRKRDVSHYLDRFPQHRTALERVIRLHAECPPSLLDRWMVTSPSLDSLPEVGDEIGPYVLRRVLGSGSFARVFLAEQTDLDNRLVVLKVSTRITREPLLLARVRHANIVEIVSHARVNDDAFQLICMPFWGGATLADVLAARRDAGRRPRSGIDLLADLDSVAAAEFPTVQTTRPAREMLAGLSYNQSIAWVGARLAEALDHAFSRDVAHGDVKPSNILLSADANPLLLDFNLARDWSPAGLIHSKIDAGGTFAYMAPERLRGLATHDLARIVSALGQPPADQGPLCEQNSQSETFTRPNRDERQLGPHQADIYALGMVLLEALTGQPPAPVATSAEPLPGTPADKLKSAASAYASARAKGARAMVREAEASGWRSINPGLRAILERCLDPDPDKRYRRGLELAEDLDRWRTDRPLIRASEPFWGQTVPRVMRRQRRAILAAAFSLVFIAATTAVAVAMSRQSLRDRGLHNISMLWDKPEAWAHWFQKSGTPRLIQADDFRVDIAKHALEEYEVLEKDNWRQRDDVRALPTEVREDLEVWLMEQVYLFCRELADRPHSPDDWLRAVKYLDHAGDPRQIPAFAALRNRLIADLGTRAPVSTAASAGTAAPQTPSWTNDYLLGVVTECEFKSEDAGHSETEPSNSKGESNEGAVVRDLQARSRRAAERALDHYNRFLVAHPDSYWGHYRAAAASYGLGSRADVAATAFHLEKCLERRPKNPMLNHHLAASSMALGHNRLAQQKIDSAIEADHDVAEFYRTRALIRTTLGETGELAEDLYHFELLSRFLPRSFFDRGRADSGQSRGTSIARGLPFPASFDFGIAKGDQAPEKGGERGIAEVDPTELVYRGDLATRIRQAGKPELAEAEFGKMLILKPDDIGARITRAMHAIDAGRLDVALSDIEVVVHHPGLADYLRNEAVLVSHKGVSNYHSLIHHLGNRSRNYCYSGKVVEGRAIARSALDLAIASRESKGECYYNLARAFAVSDQRVGKDVPKTVDYLFQAFVAHPEFKTRYAKHKCFDAVRVQVDEILANMADPSAE